MKCKCESNNITIKNQQNHISYLENKIKNDGIAIEKYKNDILSLQNKIDKLNIIEQIKVNHCIKCNNIDES